MSTPLLFQPISFRSVTARNRIVLAPMCQYSATDGLVPRHSGFDGLSVARFQPGQVIILHQDGDASGYSWLA
jgi:2,4-dienoyl-CoA reductase-like NADH-dependent reductase (Old Yellow Enzyme family)